MLTLQDLNLDLYNYLDSRALIRDYCQSAKARDPRFSLRFFAKKLGFGAPNYVKLIIEGQRNISEPTLDTWIKLLGLKGIERDYFEALVRWTQTPDLERREHYYQQLSAIRRKKLHVHQVEEAQVECLASWVHLLIREMSFLPDFSAEPAWIHKRLLYKVPPIEISKCLKDLEAAGLLVMHEGQLRAANSSITFRDEVRSLIIQKYHQGILEQAKQGLQQSLEQREYGATLVATTPEKFKLVKERLKKFRAEVLELLDTKEGEASEVVVMAFQLFHVVENAKKD